MAVPAGIEYIDKGYDIPKLNKYLDWFNLLSYDFHTSHEPAVNHHAPLYSLEEESEYNYDTELNIVKYILKWLEVFSLKNYKFYYRTTLLNITYKLVQTETNLFLEYPHMVAHLRLLMVKVMS